jgi:hypothetical protein
MAEPLVAAVGIGPPPCDRVLMWNRPVLGVDVAHPHAAAEHGAITDPRSETACYRARRYGVGGVRRSTE